MQIVVDPSSLHRSSFDSITGVLFVAADAQAFPEHGWSDFPVVVLGWWLEALQQLAATGEATFSFMDGPYEIRIRRRDESLEAELIESRLPHEHVTHKASSTFGELGASLKSAARETLTACAANGWSNADVLALERAWTLATF